jgi:hypothetical protein
VGGALALGVVAFFVTRAVRHPAPHVGPRDFPAASIAHASPTTMPSEEATPASVAKAVAPPPVLVTATTPARATAVAPVAAATVRRTILLSKVRPVAGVLVAVDGDSATEASTGKSLTLNEKPHALVFSCIEDLCEPQTRNVKGGDSDESVEVELRIKPAKLTVVGDGTKSYVIKELPQLAVQANVGASVPMSRKTETFHVRELLTNREVAVTLTAGQSGQAVFAEE